MSVYDGADAALKVLNRQALKEFSRLKMAKWDEAQLIKSVSDVYAKALKDVKRRYLEIATDACIAAMYECGMDPKEATKKCDDLIDMMWLMGLLEDVDDVTLYRFTDETERKKQRLTEALSKAQNRDAEVDKALKAWATQVGQIAISVVDRARLEGFAEAGVTEVMWNAEDDDRTCDVCEELNGQVFPIEEVPPKQHYRCRCWLTPVLDDE